jgi:hypothetical protein
LNTPPIKGHPGYRPLKVGEMVEPGDWYEGFCRFVAVSGSAMPYYAGKVKFVTRFYENCFWRHVVTEGRELGCDHPQNPDDTIPGDWLKDMPCPYPTCPAGQHGGIWHVQMPPPRISLAMTLNGGPLGEYRKITYVSEPCFSSYGRGPRKKHFRWKLER